jgi:hypothetical protein
MPPAGPDELMELMQLLGGEQPDPQQPVPPAAAPGMATGLPPPPGAPGSDPLLMMLMQLMGSAPQPNPNGDMGMAGLGAPPATGGPPMGGGPPAY